MISHKRSALSDLLRLSFVLVPCSFLVGINACEPGDCTDCDDDGWTADQGDCDDTSASTYPGAPELCDSMDNNCDGAVDEGLEGEPVEIFDSLGDNNTYNSYGDWIGTISTSYQAAAAQFTTNISGELSAIDLAMFWDNQGQNAFRVQLLNDASGQPGADVLWQEDFEGELGYYGSIAMLDPMMGPILDANTTYWLYVEGPRDGKSLSYWYHNNKNVMGCTARRVNDGEWSTYCSGENRGMRLIVGGCGG